MNQVYVIYMKYLFTNKIVISLPKKSIYLINYIV